MVHVENPDLILIGRRALPAVISETDSFTGRCELWEINQGEITKVLLLLLLLLLLLALRQRPWVARHQTLGKGRGGRLHLGEKPISGEEVILLLRLLPRLLLLSGGRDEDGVR
jgi:hypothetical protein